MKLYTLLFFLLTSSTLTAQCWPDGFTHDTRPETMWLSCEMSESPNPERPAGLWLRFDFGQAYALSTTTIWNFNEPSYLELGTTRLEVDYSSDGVNWTNWGEVELDLAPGTTDYEGEAGPDLSGVTARYILFTMQEEDQGSGCAGLSEVRFNLDQTVSSSEIENDDELDVYPNPSSGRFNIRLNGQSISEIIIYDQQGRLLDRIATRGPFYELDISHLPGGIYPIAIQDTDGKQYRRRVAKL
ncbi:MAG: T9SS type A sorting domain-containing protein [Bacteroidota bacterium]